MMKSNVQCYTAIYMSKEQGNEQKVDYDDIVSHDGLFNRTAYTYNIK